jgi:hypothetical protein
MLAVSVDFAFTADPPDFADVVVTTEFRKGVSSLDIRSIPCFTADKFWMSCTEFP